MKKKQKVKRGFYKGNKNHRWTNGHNELESKCSSIIKKSKGVKRKIL